MGQEKERQEKERQEKGGVIMNNELLCKMVIALQRPPYSNGKAKDDYYR